MIRAPPTFGPYSFEAAGRSTLGSAVAKPSSSACPPAPSSVLPVPSSRLFPSPKSPFDTEVAVLGAACVSRDDPSVPGLSWIASQDAPDAPLWAVVSDRHAVGSTREDALAEHLLSTFRSGIMPGPTSGASGVRVQAERNIVVASSALADRMSSALAQAGMRRSDDLFFGIAAAELAAKDTSALLELEPMVGDEPWRDWRVVERAILEVGPYAGPYAGPPPGRPRAIHEAHVDRILEFKRRQQRHSPPIRRFLARDPDGAPIAMIGYAPFGACDLGFAPYGVLARLRDVAVVPRARRKGVARALLRAIAARAIAECDATQVLIGAAGQGAPLALYSSVGARAIGGFVAFRGDV